MITLYHPDIPGGLFKTTRRAYETIYRDKGWIETGTDTFGNLTKRDGEPIADAKGTGPPAWAGDSEDHRPEWAGGAPPDLDEEEGPGPQ